MNRSLVLKFALSLLAAALLLFGVFAYPKSEKISGEWTVYYRGLGLNNGDSFFGRQYTILRLDYDGNHGHTDYELNGIEDECRFHAYYKNGSLSSEGICSFKPHPDFPYGVLPDETLIRRATCYRLDGSLASEVIDGNGAFMVWHANGQLFMQVEYRNGSLIKSEMWDDDGEYRDDMLYVNE